jgi:hypothetical protein
MRTKSGAWIWKGGALTVVFLIVFLGKVPAFGKVRDHGKELVIQKKDGAIIKGELIAVRGASLLLNSTTSSENSVDMGDVSVITIINKSQLLAGAGIGLLSGATFGIALGIASGSDKPTGWFAMTAGEKAMLAAGLLGGVGAILGGIGGAIAGVDEMIKIREPRDPEKIAKLLEKLRSKSRFPDEK